jgi:hypothetical protein
MAKGSVKFTADTRQWERLSTLVKGLDGSVVRVGLLSGKAGAGGSNGSTDIGDGMNLATLGAVHEFGTMDERIPARPWLRQTFIALRQDLVKLTIKLTRNIVLGRIKTPQAYELLGLWGSNAVKTYVKGNNVKPATTAATIARKSAEGKEKTTTLIDTGIMVNSVTYDVAARAPDEAID